MKLIITQSPDVPGALLVDLPAEPPIPVAAPAPRKPTLVDFQLPAREQVAFLLLPSRALGLPRSAGAPFPDLLVHQVAHTRAVLELDP